MNKEAFVAYIVEALLHHCTPQCAKKGVYAYTANPTSGRGAYIALGLACLDIKCLVAGSGSRGKGHINPFYKFFLQKDLPYIVVKAIITSPT